MGTETILQLAGAGGHHHHHHHQQQRQHNQTQPYLSDGGGAFCGDSVKASGDGATQPHLDVFANNHPHIHPPPGASVKLPPVVGIYRPPAARRALQLAEKAFHQLAPPAACDHPSDYTHLPVAELTTDKAVLRSPDSTESAPRNNEGKTGEKTGPTSESGASSNKWWSPTQQASPPAAEGTLGSDCNSVTSIVVSPTSARVNRPHRERRPDRAVYVPRARRSLTTPPVTTSSLLPAAGDAASKAAAPIAGSPPKGLTRAVVSSSNRTQPPDTDAVAASGEAVASSSSCCPVVVLSPEGTGSKGKQKPHTESAAAESSTSVGYSLAGGTVQCNKSVLNCDSVIEESSKRRTAQSSHQRVPGEAFKQRSCSLEEQQNHQQTAVTRLEDSDTREDRLQIVNEVSCDLAQQQQQQQQRKQQQSSSGQESSNAICDFQRSTNSREYPLEGGPVVLSIPTVETNDTMHRTNNRHRNAKNVTTVPANTTTTGMIINDRPTEGEKLDRDEKELRRASQEMNRSNRRIMKQTFNSDVLEIDEPAPPKPPGGGGLAKKSEKKVVVQNGDTNGVGKPSAIVPATINGGGGGCVATQNGKVSDGDGAGEENEDEEDWESMYDDNGDCLNPKMLEELTSTVGKVSIEAPHSDYKAYQTKQAVLNEEEFPHVLEVSNFPAEFKTQDLMMLFSQYKESGFDIKWVDDTHALAVFSSSKIAAEVLATGHSFAQVKPLAEATSESRSKARKCASSLQPYRARPETCAALARRLVTTALGVRLKTAPEERENERRVLREAKERKLLAAKQRDEVWDS
uniref:R3H domain-containing protein n=1 Tax=Anopheles atroparvus TaxID=41427 RepID=A0AAG5CR44_ANOAO